MNVIELRHYGGPEALVVVERPKPSASAEQILIRVLATSVNPIDPVRAGGGMRQVFPLSFPFVPGGDFSGVVEAVGHDVDRVSIGDAVYGYLDEGGAYAEYVAVDANQAAPKPDCLSHVEAASLALVGQTALQALKAAEVAYGQTVLIHGASGAVGGVAVQIAHRLGARVIATSSADSLDRVRSYGADVVIDRDATPFEMGATEVDVVIDTVGGDVQRRSLGVIRSGGTLVALSQPPSEDDAAGRGVRAFMLHTSTSTDNLNALTEWIERGEIKPFVSQTYSMTDAARAWRDAALRELKGKLVLQPQE